MAFNYISAAEAASLIKHGYNIGLSGFTPAGTAKAVTAELAKIAEAKHAKGNPFQVGMFRFCNFCQFGRYGFGCSCGSKSA